MRPTKLLFAAAVPVVVVASVAIAGQFKNVFVDTDVVARSGVSGGDGTESKLGYDGYFLYEIAWGETYDRPCSFQVKGARRSSDVWQMPTEEKLLMTKWCKEEDSFKVTANAPTSDGSSGKFISGIRVCHTENHDSDGQRIKGIAIRTSRVDENGVVTKGGEDDHQLTHCKTWSNWVECKSGQLARRLILNGSEYVKGIELECAPVYTGARPK